MRGGGKRKKNEYITLTKDQLPIPAQEANNEQIKKTSNLRSY